MQQWRTILCILISAVFLVAACNGVNTPNGDNTINDEMPPAGNNMPPETNNMPGDDPLIQGQGMRHEQNRQPQQGLQNQQSQQQNQQNQHQNQQNQQQQQGNMLPNNVEDSQQIAERLVELATEVDDVEGATAVAIGDWAVVGIDVDEDLDRDKVGTVKYSVAEALKDDPYGAHAVISADPDVIQRLQNMASDIEAGHPIEGFMDELAGIVGRLMPQMPRNEQDPDQAEHQYEQEQNLNQNRGQQQQGPN